MSKIVGSTSSLLVLVFVAGQAAAQPQPGESGTLALGVDRLFGFHYATETQEAAGVETSDSVTSIALLGKAAILSIAEYPRLSADYFVDPGISLGGSLMYASYSPDSDGATLDTSAGIFVVSARVGYATMFNENVGLWPRIGLTYGHMSTSVKGTNSAGGSLDAESSGSQLLLDLEAMLIVSPAPHVGFTLGPTFDYELSRSAETDGEDTLEGVSTSFTDFGLQAGFVAWL